MYPQSSQKKHWTFLSEQELIQLRMKHNQEFIAVHGAQLDVSFAMFRLFTFFHMSLCRAINCRLSS